MLVPIDNAGVYRRKRYIGRKQSIKYNRYAGWPKNMFVKVYKCIIEEVSSYKRHRLKVKEQKKILHENENKQKLR